MFSFYGVTPAAGLCSWRFFGMQNHRTCLWRVLIEKLGERASARQTAGHNITSARLGFHDRDIWFAGNGEKIIGGAAAHQAGCPIMIRQGDLVHAFSIGPQHPNPATNERPRFNGRAQSHDANVIAIVDLELSRELGRDFGEHFRLEFG